MIALGFTGERMGAVDGTVYLRARHYQPALGRFLQRDTFPGIIGRPQSLNRYPYAHNNPVTWLDPSGRDVPPNEELPGGGPAGRGGGAGSGGAEGGAGGPGGASTEGVVYPSNVTYTPVNPRPTSTYDPPPECNGVGEAGGLKATDGPVARATILDNAVAGAAREAVAAEMLKSRFPGDSILRERYIRDASGRWLVDTQTGRARRLDFVVVRKGQVTNMFEVTSIGASKKAQHAKTLRILDKGGAFVRDPATRSLMPVPPSVVEEILRLP